MIRSVCHFWSFTAETAAVLIGNHIQEVDCESSLLQLRFTFHARLRPPVATVIITSAKEEVRRRWVNQLLQFLYRRKQMPTVNYFKFITSFWVMLCSWLRPCVLGIAEDRRVQLLQHSPKHLRDFWKKKKKSNQLAWFYPSVFKP